MVLLPVFDEPCGVAPLFLISVDLSLIHIYKPWIFLTVSLPDETHWDRKSFRSSVVHNATALHCQKCRLSLQFEVCSCGFNSRIDGWPYSEVTRSLHCIF